MNLADAMKAGPVSGETGRNKLAERLSAHPDLDAIVGGRAETMAVHSGEAEWLSQSSHEAGSRCVLLGSGANGSPHGPPTALRYPAVWRLPKEAASPVRRRAQ